MIYRLDELVVNYIDNIVDRDACICNMKLAMIEGKETNLRHEIDIASKKVDIVMQLFNEIKILKDAYLAPIEKCLYESEYKVIRAVYFDRTGESLTDLKKRLNISNACRCKQEGLKKLR